MLSLTPVPKQILKAAGYIVNGPGLHALGLRMLTSPAPESEDRRATL